MKRRPNVRVDFRMEKLSGSCINYAGMGNINNIEYPTLLPYLYGNDELSLKIVLERGVDVKNRRMTLRADQSLYTYRREKVRMKW